MRHMTFMQRSAHISEFVIYVCGNGKCRDRGCNKCFQRFRRVKEQTLKDSKIKEEDQDEGSMDSPTATLTSDMMSILD